VKNNEILIKELSKIEAKIMQGIYEEDESPFIFINGVRLDEMLSKINGDFFGLYPSWQARGYGFVLEEAEKKYVLYKSGLDKGVQILPILLCPDDWDFFCTVILVEVIPSEDTVIWNRFGLDISEDRCKYDEEGNYLDKNDNVMIELFDKIQWYSEIKPFVFDRKEYENCIKIFDNWSKIYHEELAEINKKLNKKRKNKTLLNCEGDY